MKTPCIILAVLSVVAGFVNTPRGLGHVQVFSRFLDRALPPMADFHGAALGELASESFVTIAFVAGLIASYYLFLARRRWMKALMRPAAAQVLHRFWFSDWGMDWLYDRVFVQPIAWFARVNKGDIIDRFYDGIAAFIQLCWSGLRATETGLVRWYAASIVFGAVLFTALALFG
jgi:NADH-quinone oxidoreductase subunit L